MSCFKLAIFDWNGTILNDTLAGYKAIENIFGHFNVKPPTMTEFCEEIPAGLARIAHKYGIAAEVTDVELNRLWAEFFVNGCGESVSLQDDTLLFLAIMERFRLSRALVSSEHPEVLNKRLLEFGLYNRFDYVRGGAWPKDEALREVILKFGVRPEEAFYLDDTPHGIQAAKSVGIKTIGYPNGYNSRERILVAQPDYLFDSVGRVVSVIANGCRE